MSSGGSGSGADTTFTIYRIPLSAILKWPPGQFVNPPTRHWYVPYAAVLQGLSTVVVAVRLWTRFNKRAGILGIDDILIIIAWLFASGAFGIGVYGVMDAGLDRHVWNILPEVAGKAGLVAWVTEILFLCSLCCTKASVLLFFLRLINRSHYRTLYWAVMGGILFIFVYWLAFILVLIFSCKPIDAVYKSMNLNWNGQYTCIQREACDITNGALSVVTDVYSVAIPVFIVSKLTMSWMRKAVLYVVFCCSLVVVGASTARTVYMKRMYTEERGDLTTVGYDLLVWATLELQLALICASAPAMKGFFSKVGEAVASKYDSQFGSSSSQPYSRSAKATKDKELARYDTIPLSWSSLDRKKQSEKFAGKQTLEWPKTGGKLGIISMPQTYCAKSGTTKTGMKRTSSNEDCAHLNGNGIHVEQSWFVSTQQGDESRADRLSSSDEV